MDVTMKITNLLKFVNPQMWRKNAKIAQLSTTQAVKPIKIAKYLQISRQAVYKWLNGEMSSTKISKYVNTVLSTSFPARLDADSSTKAKKLILN